jgi:hypothetical protein
MAVNRAIININMLPIGAVHELIAAFDVTWPKRQRLQQKEFSDSKINVLTLPGALVPRRIEAQFAALNRGLGFAAGAAREFAASQQSTDALDQEPLRERLLDVVVGTHTQSQDLIDLIVFRGEKDDRHRAVFAKMAQQFHSIHARHLDIENRKISRLRGEAFEGLGAVRIASNGKTLGLERHGD